MESKKTRIDKYLWAIRIFKTRNLAQEAIESGKVKLLGQSVKASRTVQIGDCYDIKTAQRFWKIEVLGILDNRLSYELVQKYYKDHTPIEEQQTEKPLVSAFYTGKRLSKTGRPTKKQRRDLNDILLDSETDL